MKKDVSVDAAKWTDAYIRNIQPKNKRFEVREPHNTGFCLWIYPSGEKTFVYTYFFVGDKRRLALGQYGKAYPLKQARKDYYAEKVKVNAGRDPYAERLANRLKAKEENTAHKESPSVETFIKRYIKDWAKPNKKTWKEDKRILLKELEPLFKVKVKNITQKNIVDVLNAITDRGALISRERTFAAIRKMFNFAIEEAIIDTSPLEKIKAKTKGKRRERYLTDDEIKLFWCTIDNAPMATMSKTVLKLTLLTGQRSGEVVAIENKDLKGKVWTIPGSKTKNGLIHRVHLIPLAMELIGQAKKINSSSNWLFRNPNTDTHILQNSISKALFRCFKLPNSKMPFKGIDIFKPHDLRRTMTTKLGEIGVSRFLQDRITNHIDSSIGGIYDQYDYDKEKMRAMTRYSDALSKILNSPKLVRNN